MGVRLAGTWQTARVQQHVPFCCAAYSGEDACVAGQPSQPGAEPTPARCGPAIEEVIAVEGAAGSGTASAKVPGSAPPGNYLVAARQLGRVRLLPGWPAGQGWLQLPVMVVALSWV